MSESRSSYMMDTCGLGLPMTVGSDGGGSCDLRGVTPRVPEKLGRRSRGGMDGAAMETVVPNVLVDV